MEVSPGVCVSVIVWSGVGYNNVHSALLRRALIYYPHFIKHLTIDVQIRDRQTKGDEQTDSQTGRQTDKQAGNQAGRQIFTLDIFSLLSGLHGLADLHADDVDLGLAVLQHLLGRLMHLLVLQATPYSEDSKIADSSQIHTPD